MIWLLLNQLFVNLDYQGYKISVLEEVVSSEVQLVQVLVSGRISQETMNSVNHHLDISNLIGQRKESRL